MSDHGMSESDGKPEPGQQATPEPVAASQPPQLPHEPATHPQPPATPEWPAAPAPEPSPTATSEVPTPPVPEPSPTDTAEVPLAASPDATANQPTVVHPGHPTHPLAPAFGHPGQPIGGPGYGGQPHYGPNPPVWQPPAAARSTNGGTSTVVKWVVGSVAAVALALCSGVTGAVVATQLLDDKGSPITTGDPTATAPILDRGSLAEVAAEVQPSVVSINAGNSQGSGVVLTADGFILTNNHVVEGASGSLTVVLSDGKRVRATVVGTDPKTDLAVIKAEATGLKAAVFADSDATNVGDTVLAIGSPLGLQGSVTAGIVSAKDRTIGTGTGTNRSGSISGLLQTDAPINPGNSGGALVNMGGEVVGINTAIATNGSNEGNIGLGFAIPSNKAKQVAEQLMAGKKVSHPQLGVNVNAAENGGAQVINVAPGSAAEKAGLQEGDIITKFGDRVINDADDLVSAVQSGTVGQPVTVEFTRNGESMTATVSLAEASN